jgi:hypothetical protein
MVTTRFGARCVCNAWAESRETSVPYPDKLDGMSGINYRPIDPERLQSIRDRGQDEFGNAWKPHNAGGWEPLRCCLRKAVPDEEITLICYTPWTEPSPWAEAGPVFVHHTRCAGYPDHEVYPPELRNGRRMLNPFDHTGARAYDHITFVSPEQDHEAAVRRVLEQPEVAFLHVRSATAGCFTFEAHLAD